MAGPELVSTFWTVLLFGAGKDGGLPGWAFVPIAIVLLLIGFAARAYQRRR